MMQNCAALQTAAAMAAAGQIHYSCRQPAAVSAVVDKPSAVAGSWQYRLAVEWLLLLPAPLAPHAAAADSAAAVTARRLPLPLPLPA